MTTLIDRDACPIKQLPSVAELRHELMVAMGAGLLSLQFFELYASGCLLALCGDERYGVEDLFSGDTLLRGPTVATLVARFRKLMPLDPRFEDRLNSFIEKRNVFIHRLFISDLGPNKKGDEAALYDKLAFILDLMRETKALKPVFCGLYSLIHKAQIAEGHIESNPALDQEATEMEKYEHEIISVLRRERVNEV
jgi:hypothetical protein